MKPNISTHRPPPPPQRDQSGFRWMSIVWGVLAIPLSFIALMSLMMFDAPGSENSLLTQILFLSIFTAPIIFLVSCIGAGSFD